MPDPRDFTGNPPAFVEIGDGSAHDPQLKIEAPDNSCVWNDFPICISYPPELQCGTTRAAGSSQLLSFVTTAGVGGSSPSTAQWPHAFVYDYLDGLLCGKQLQARIRFTATSGGTSVGSVAVANVNTGGSCGAKPGPILGAYDSGWFDIACEDCTLAGYNLELALRFTNFNPLAGVVQIDHGILDLQWVDGTPDTVFSANDPGSIQWRPPCYSPGSSMVDLPPGLWIALPSNSCGELYKTYSQVANDIDALGLGFDTTILGGHGADIAYPDPHCPVEQWQLRDWSCCPLSGAICSGSVDDPAKGGGEFST